MLLIACINFMNLSTASAGKRAKEVGIRKVMGSLKGQLVRQFLLESILLTLVALILAVVFVKLALPVFNDIAGKNLRLELLNNPWLLPGLLVLGLITSVLAGSYPAFFISSFKPVAVLKGQLTSGKKSAGLRSGLVVFQFFISITLMVSTAVVYSQLSFIQNKKLGYNKEQVLILPDTWMLGQQKQQILRQQLLQDPRAASVTGSWFLPAGPSNGNNFFVYEDKVAEQIKTLRYEVDYSYIPTLGMELVAGRNFSKDFGTDSASVIVNETTVAAMGWGKDALGKMINRTDGDGVKASYRVIGVVKDFHFKSLHERISPLVMTLNDGYGTLIIKTKTKDIASLVSSIQSKWEQLGTGAPFSYTFLDKQFTKVYEAEQNTGRILGIFAGLTHFCGLPRVVWPGHLYSPAAQQRNKHPESAGRQCYGHYILAFKRLPQVGRHCVYYSSAHCLVYYEQMVTGF